MQHLHFHLKLLFLLIFLDTFIHHSPVNVEISIDEIRSDEGEVISPISVTPNKIQLPPCSADCPSQDFSLEINYCSEKSTSFTTNIHFTDPLGKMYDLSKCSHTLDILYRLLHVTFILFILINIRHHLYLAIILLFNRILILQLFNLILILLLFNLILMIQILCFRDRNI